MTLGSGDFVGEIALVTELIERAIDPDARPWLGRRLGAAAKTPPTLAG